MKQPLSRSRLSSKNSQRSMNSKFAFSILKPDCLSMVKKEMYNRIPLIAATVMLFVVTSLPLLANGSSLDLSFEEANMAFSKGKYAQATEIYQSILEEWGYSAPILYNLANSYAMSGKTGLAVLNYERALALTPGDSDISANLKMVKTANGLFEQDATFPDRIVNALNINQWSFIGGLAVLTLTILVAGIVVRKIPWKIGGALCCGCLLTVIIAGSCIVKLYGYWEGSVIIDKTRLQVSPFAGAASVGDIKEGSRVYTRQRHGDYYYVVDETERKGWVSASAVEPIIPERPDRKSTR